MTFLIGFTLGVFTSVFRAGVDGWRRGRATIDRQVAQARCPGQVQPGMSVTRYMVVSDAAHGPNIGAMWRDEPSYIPAGSELWETKVEFRRKIR